MKRGIVLLAVLSLVLSACGGNADNGADDVDGDTATTRAEAESGSDSGATPTETTVPADDDSGPADPGDSDGSGPSTATVTIGDQTYNFSTEGAVVAQCLTDLFGIFSVQLPRVDDSGAPADGSIAIVALREGTDPDEMEEVNAVEVSVDDEDWIADEADMVFEMYEVMEPGMSQVDSVEIDGRTVRGTATFVREFSLFGDEPEVVTGTFEATCGEERTS